MNILMCSAGRRCELIKNFRKSMGRKGKIVATDLSPYAPALCFADKFYLVPKITEDSYIDVLLDVCRKEKIQAVFTLIDPEIAILSENRKKFEDLGIKVFVPFYETAKICFDKFEMYKYLVKCQIPTVTTYGSLEDFLLDYNTDKIHFPVFVKPRTGSGSIGARRIENLDDLQIAMSEDSSLIIQEFMDGIDLDADVYVDSVSGEVVSAFSKKKISTTIGGANKTISFKDDKLFEFIKRVASVLNLYGPNDMDFFYRDGRYYLSEINPRFGGAYLHAYGAGVDFIKLIENNISEISNKPNLGDYSDNIVMMMYDAVVIKRQEDLLS